MTARSLVSGVLVLLAGCPAAPVTYSAPVGISMHAKSSEATNGLVIDNKRISTEQGNPYGAFVSEAKAQLAGRSPTVLVVEGAQLSLGEGSSGVTSLAEVYGGNVTIEFLIDDSNNSFGVANGIVDLTADDALELAPHFDSGALSEFDYLKLLGGHFSVVARGTAARGFADKGANGDLGVTLTFSAFE